MKNCKIITLSLAIFFVCMTAVHAQDQAKIDRLSKEMTEISNRAVSRGSLTEQEQARIQAIVQEIADEYNTPQVQQIKEQLRRKEEQEWQRNETESLNKSLAMGANVPEKLSVKYKSAEYARRGEALIITWDNRMKRVRTDKWFSEGGGGRYIYIVDAANKTTCQHHYGGWQDDQFTASEYYNRTVSVKERICSEEQLTSRWGRAFVKQSLPDRTYAGKTCRVFLMTEVKSGYTLSVTYAIWNNVVLFYEYKSTNHGESTPFSLDTYEAVSVTENVPEAAFTKTLNITWH
jgi:hypothetical protein